MFKYVVKISSMLFWIVAECIFDSKDQYNINSVKFSIKKVFIYIVTISSIVLNLLLFPASYKLSSTNIDLKNKIKYESKIAEDVLESQAIKECRIAEKVIGDIEKQ